MATILKGAIVTADGMGTIHEVRIAKERELAPISVNSGSSRGKVWLPTATDLQKAFPQHFGFRVYELPY